MALDLLEELDLTSTGDNVDEGFLKCKNNWAVVDTHLYAMGITVPRQIIVEMGDWDMDTDAVHQFAHGLDDSKIVGIRALVRDDADNARYSMSGNYYAGATDMQGGIISIGSVYVVLGRTTGGVFDGTSFDSTTYNRGWVIIDYID